MPLSALLGRENFDAGPWGCHLGTINWDKAGALAMGHNQQDEVLGIYESLLAEAYEDLRKREEDRRGQARGECRSPDTGGADYPKMSLTRSKKGRSSSSSPGF